jgi:uncharacterized membrane protein YkvA (DUF1232 family)
MISKNDEVIFGEILEPDGDVHQDKRQRNVRKNFWIKVRRAANKIPMMDEVVAAYFCAMDPATPTRVKGILLAALAYFILPLDLVPDFLAFVGFSDDIAVLSVAISAVSANITDAHREAAKAALSEKLDDQN